MHIGCPAGTPASLAAALEKYTNGSLWPGGKPVSDNILTVSLGDEIGVAGAGTDVGFVAFLQTKGQNPADVGCAKPSWAAVLAACNTTTGVCPECGAVLNVFYRQFLTQFLSTFDGRMLTLAGRNTSIAVAVTPATNKLFYFSNLYGNEAGLLHFKTITSTIQKTLPRAKIGANFSPVSSQAIKIFYDRTFFSEMDCL